MSRYYKWDPIDHTEVELVWKGATGPIHRYPISIRDIIYYIRSNNLDTICNIDCELLLNIIVNCDYMIMPEWNPKIWLPNTVFIVKELN